VLGLTTLRTLLQPRGTMTDEEIAAIPANTSLSLVRRAQEEIKIGLRYFAIVAVPCFGFLLVAAGGCDSSASTAGSANCPPPDNFARINLECVPVEPPVVKTTGPCTVCKAALADGSIPEGAYCTAGLDSQIIMVMGNDAGTCHVEMTFGNGPTSAVDVDFVSVWRPLGSDPHGCGQEFAAVIESGSGQVSVTDQMCDAGPDAERLN
jgi:hypothetical protein